MDAAELGRVRMMVAGAAALVLFLRTAAGRLAPRAALAPLVFLITRWPVLLGWSVGTFAMAAMLVNGAAEHGKDVSSELPTLVGLSLFCGLGFAALAVGPLFMAMRAFAKPPELPLEPGETLIRELVGNHFLNGESRGGKLLVTDRRLAFRPHRFNVQLDTWSVPRSQIRSAESSGARFLVLHTAAGSDEWLVVWNPEELASELTGGAGLAIR